MERTAFFNHREWPFNDGTESFNHREMLFKNRRRADIEGTGVFIRWENPFIV